MSYPEAVFPMGGGLAGPMGGAGGGLPEDMMFGRMAHLETFIGSFAPHLIDTQIDDIPKRLLILAIENKGGTTWEGKVPFMPTIIPVPAVPPAESNTYKLRMAMGYIHTQLVDSEENDDIMVDLPVDGIPIKGSEITVTANTKCWVIADEDANGKITNPSFATGFDWPASMAPKIKGGEDETGQTGFRTWRLCEIKTSGDSLIAVVHRAGIIEHYAPRRVENTTNVISQEEGRIFKESLAEDGTYRMRAVRGKRGMKIAEGTDDDADFLLVGLPEANQGDILFYQGDAETGSWIVLAAPSSGIHVLTHNGTAPEWSPTYECPSSSP